MYQLKEVSDVWIDACVKDKSGFCLFASLIGSETEILALTARLSLSKNNDEYLESISFQDDEKVHILRLPSDVEKVTQRMNATASANGIHAFWHQRSLLPQYFEIGKGVMIYPTGIDELTVKARLWSLVKEVSRPPLLDHWSDVVVEYFEDEGWIKPLESYGRVAAFDVDLPIDKHVDVIERLVKSKVLVREE